MQNRQEQVFECYLNPVQAWRVEDSPYPLADEDSHVMISMTLEP